MKPINEVILFALFVVYNVKESVVTGEDVASISENLIEHDVKEPSLSTRGVCLGNDECCSCNKQCCTNVCTEEKCICKEEGDECFFPRECCSESCENGLCVSTSKADGNQCERNADCISQLCSIGYCVSCFGPGDVGCQSDTQCCQGECSFGRCLCGSSSGTTCSNDKDCCGGECDTLSGTCTCSFGKCDKSGTPPCCHGECMNDGTGTETFQCSKIAKDGKCQYYRECISGLCVKDTCICATQGQQCTSNINCCSGLTCDDSQTPNVCK